MVPYKTIQHLGNSCSFVGLIDVFSYCSPRTSPSGTSLTGQGHSQAAGQRSVVYEQDEGIGFTDLLRMIRKIYGYRMHSFFSF
jgi:hypothetical protein